MHIVVVMLDYLLIRITSKKHIIPTYNMLNENIHDLVHKIIIVCPLFVKFEFLYLLHTLVKNNIFLSLYV